MSKTVIVAIIIFIIMVSGIIITYYFVEKKNLDEYAIANITIIAKDMETGEYVKTDYNILSDSVYYGTGTTNRKSAILRNVPGNVTIEVYNVNIEDQFYYTNIKKQYVLDNEIYRIVLELEKFSPLEIAQIGVIGVDEEINLTLKSSGFSKNVVGCFTWGLHTIYTKIDVSTNYTEIDSILDFDKCYDLGIINEGKIINLPLSYKSFGILDENDFINITFLDYNKIPFLTEKNYTIQQTYEIE